MRYYYYRIKGKILILTVRTILFIYPLLRTMFTKEELTNLNNNLIKDLDNMQEILESFEEEDKE